MYASIGFGANSATKIISRMLEEYRKVHKEENIEQKIEQLKEKEKNKVSVGNCGIIVKGIDNCLVKLSKCCNPVPGDEIIGYITRGRGVSVHRKDCKNINDLVSEENRIIDVSWACSKQVAYNVDIEIFANDRQGLLADIINVIQNSKTKLIAVSSRANKEKVAITEITVEVENLDKLNKLSKELRKIDCVYEVNRKK